MKCVDVARMLDPYGDGELDLAASLEVEAHLESCARCRASMAGMHSLRRALERSCAPRAAGSVLTARVGAAIAREPAHGGWRLLRSPLAAAVPGLVALALAGWLVIADWSRSSTQVPAAPTRVVYHISNSDTAGAALRNLSNHLKAEPEARIVVVAHNDGVDFLLRGARDASGGRFQALVKDFHRRGVEFRVCYNTLERRHIASGEVIPEATLVPSGIAEIGRLQSREGYAYMRL